MNGSPTEVQQLLAAVHTQQQSIERLLRLLESQATPAVKPSDAADAPPATPEPSRRSPINWDRIRGDERRVAWRDVAAFTEMVVVRHSIQFDLRPCWWKHADAVEELTALMHIYEASYADDAGPAGAMSWRDNYSKSFYRLASMFVSCRDGHIEAAKQGWMTASERAAFQRHVETDVSAAS